MCVLWYSPCFAFFFSTRRRYTSYWRDWSSDVCSSDLAFTEEMDNTVMSARHSGRLPIGLPSPPQAPERYEPIHPDSGRRPLLKRLARVLAPLGVVLAKRSEDRRDG